MALRLQGLRPLILVGLASLACAPIASAQSGASGRSALQPASPAAEFAQPRRIVNPKRETLARMMKPVTYNFEEQRLEDCLDFIRTQTGADMEIMWLDGGSSTGLDKDRPITAKGTDITALSALERLLSRAVGDSGENSWQLGDHGELQIGPKERLNGFKRVELYDISDLLIEVPEYDQVPTIDLQTALSASQGGGQSPFQANQNEQNQPGERDRRKRELADELISLITELVEPAQWEAGGGQGGSIRYFQGQLIVSAPDYMHRQLAGYPFWPKGSTTISRVEGRRYVTLGVDPSLSNIDGFAQGEASAVAGGQVITSGPGGGR
jgi:hypothetical protein